MTDEKKDAAAIINEVRFTESATLSGESKNYLIYELPRGGKMVGKVYLKRSEFKGSIPNSVTINVLPD